MPQGKGQTVCMAWKKKGAGTAAHAEQRELKPPVFSCGPSYTYKKISGGTGYGMVSIRFSGNIRNGSSGISPVCIARASRRSQFAPVIILQIEAGLPPHSFSRQFSPAPAARKIATKRVWEMRLARPVRFSFDGRGNCPACYPVLSDLFLGNPVHAHFLVKGRAADAQQGCRLCQVAFRYGDRHPDLFRIPLFDF